MESQDYLTEGGDPIKKKKRSFSLVPSSLPGVKQNRKKSTHSESNIIDLEADKSSFFSGSRTQRRVSNGLMYVKEGLKSIPKRHHHKEATPSLQVEETEDCKPSSNCRSKPPLPVVVDSCSKPSNLSIRRMSIPVLPKKNANSLNGSHTSKVRGSLPDICSPSVLAEPDSSESLNLFSNYRLKAHRPSLTYDEQFDLLCKVVLVGDAGVGKTCFLLKYNDGAFLSGAYISTVGLDFRNKVITVDDTKVKLQIWDTAGQERFRSVTHAYYRDAHALLLLYDVMNKHSFDNTRGWLAEVREYAQDDVVIMLIGNKCDIPPSERQIRREDGERLAREYNVTFMETSAKTGINVDLAFMAVARDLKARKSCLGLEQKFNVADYVSRQEKIDQCTCSLA